MIYVLMGVCGSGKTTVGTRLAEKLNCVFRDADTFHTEENKIKMANGVALTDDDRLPWLLAIHDYLARSEQVVVTCSALKKSYRRILRYGENKTDDSEKSQFMPISLKLVYLKGNSSVLTNRMQNRKGHFMPATMLASQLATMEEPDDSEDCLIFDVEESVDGLVEKILDS